MRFAYSTIKSLRDFQVPINKVSDKLANKLIPFYSDRITQILSKQFVPVKKVITFNRSEKIFKIPGSPVIKVLGLYYNMPNTYTSDLSRTLLDEKDYRVNGNTLTLYLNIPSRAYLELECIVGNLDNQKEVEVQLNTSITTGTEEFEVEDASELDERDVLVIENRCFIINEINYDTNMIFIDKQQSMRTIDEGEKVICYGQVPLSIEHAVNLFISNHKMLTKQFGGVIQREKTEQYEYSLFNNSHGITGIPEIDKILFSYMENEIDLFYL